MLDWLLLVTYYIPLYFSSPSHFPILCLHCNFLSFQAIYFLVLIIIFHDHCVFSSLNINVIFAKWQIFDQIKNILYKSFFSVNDFLLTFSISTFCPLKNNTVDYHNNAILQDEDERNENYS